MDYAVAIDGPAGSGKSTVAKILATNLKLIYIDTGAMYRLVALYCIKNAVSTTDEAAVKQLLKDIEIDIKTIDGVQRFFLNGNDVSEEIRTAQVGQGASDVAIFLPVRQKLVLLQREMAKNNSVIMDGRDIATNVLSDAKVKIYLDASVTERAKRRLKDYESLNLNYTLDEVIEQIKIRDNNDMNREHNPLCMASDAKRIDTSGMDINSVVKAITEEVKSKTGLEL